MDNNPLVSICIPTFNRANMVRRAILSSINQTYRNIEIIVVDNASTDNTREVVVEYANRDKRVKYFRNDKNIGSGNNFLKCLEYATGYFSQALGSDDWLSKNYIEDGVKIFAADPDAAAVLSDVITMEFSKQDGKFKFLDKVPLKSGRYSADWFFRHIYLGGAGGMGFISFLRREDSLVALKKVINNPVNMFDRGDRKEPFDMPVFLETLAKYDHFSVTKEAAYIKTVHGKDHVGLEGDSFGSKEGMVNYALALRLAFEAFYSEHGFKKYFRQLRFFGGLSIAANTILNSVKRWPGKEKYFLAVKSYFNGYSKKEKSLIFISVIPYIFWRIIKRFFGLFVFQSDFKPNEDKFLTEESKFSKI